MHTSKRLEFDTTKLLLNQIKTMFAKNVVRKICVCINVGFGSWAYRFQSSNGLKVFEVISTFKYKCVITNFMSLSTIALNSELVVWGRNLGLTWLVTKILKGFIYCVCIRDSSSRLRTMYKIKNSFFGDEILF